MVDVTTVVGGAVVVIVVIAAVGDIVGVFVAAACLVLSVAVGVVTTAEGSVAVVPIYGSLLRCLMELSSPAASNHRGSLGWIRRGLDVSICTQRPLLFL